MRWLLVVLVLAGFSDPVGFSETVPLDLTDPIWEAKYAAMEACSGSDGDFAAARWFGIPRADVDGWSRWAAPHDVYVFGTQVGEPPTGAVEVNSFHDGALRHILRTNEVPQSVLQTCGVPERVI